MALNAKMKEQMEKMKNGEIGPGKKKKGEKQAKAESFLASIGMRSTVLTEISYDERVALRRKYQEAVKNGDHELAKKLQDQISGIVHDHTEHS
jgi:hypothetical protein